MSRRTLSLGLLALWVAALAWLARRELWRPQADTMAEAGQSLPPGAIYYAIAIGDRQVGYASTTVDTLGDTLRLSEVVVLEMPGGDGTARVDARTDIRLTRALRLIDFTTTVRGDEARYSVAGSREGDSILALSIGGAGGSNGARVPLARPLLLSQALPLTIALRGDLVLGRTSTTRVLDPVLLDLEDVSFDVAAESTFVVADSAVFDSVSGRFIPVVIDTVPAWELRFQGPGPARSLWVDDDGLPVLETTASGFRLSRSAFEVVYENFRRFGPGAGRTDTALPNTPVPRTVLASGVGPPRQLASRSAFRLGGRPLEGLALDGGRQRRSGDTVFVVREGAAELTSGYRPPIGRREMAEWVRATPLIQSDDPRIQAQARQIVGRARRAEDAAERLVQWVHQNVTKQATPGGAGALDVLLTARGDCGEHTILLVALARAVGLPARSVTGLVYLDGAFYYHAWPEVYLNGWVAVDPTFGQFPADAARIRLDVGGLARRLELVRLIGRLTIEGLPADPGG
jgi:hypothetical protein